MDSLHTGSNELLYVQTDLVSLIIKGPASHPNFQNCDVDTESSTTKISCMDDFEFTLKGEQQAGINISGNNVYSGIYSSIPIFYEQQKYEILIEAADGHTVSFWHDNLNIRNKVTKSSRLHEIWSGIINFSNDIGMSDLVIMLDGKNYMRITIEVFPSKISYKEDYKNIVSDVTAEIYNIVFDFLKKTYLGYEQTDRISNSPVEFFAIIRKIYDDFIRAADMILIQPHHLLETIHEVVPAYKAKRTDTKTLRWIEKHSGQAKVKNGNVVVQKALAVRKQITYDTKENRLTKYILQFTSKKLAEFKKNYLRLQRAEDISVINEIDLMINGINRRCNTSFLMDINAREADSGMSLVFSMAPGYRELYKYYLMLLRGLSITGDIFNISIKDLAVLYEYWCFIKLNSLMKEKYKLVSQDIIKVQGNGLYISLVKGTGSVVKYINPRNGEKIILSYNPKSTNVPTVTQRPDNVLKLQKNGANSQYEYVFDAKYKINPALPNSDYYNSISHNPGPEVDDINTMHRYRDAIVYQNGATPYERIMFGAYVLFPYSNESEYKDHRFYKSISKVNIGGLPFLPSATKLVSKMLDELISDSPDSAFERNILPIGIEEKLAKVNWNKRDVLVGTFKNIHQFNVCKNNKFYYVPAERISNQDLPIHYIAMYQTKKLFGNQSGIKYYGEVVRCSKVKRSEITEIPSYRTSEYYRLEVSEWKELSKPILPREKGFITLFTNLFLLEHSSEIPELFLKSEEEYRLYLELKRSVNDMQINDDENEVGFSYNKSRIIFENGKIHIYKDGKIIDEHTVQSFTRSPNAVFRSIQDKVLED